MNANSLVAFVAVQVLLLVVSFYIKLKIDEAKSLPSSKRVIKVPVQKSPLAPADEASEKEQTVYQYDSDQWSAALKANVMQLLILGFIHYKWTIAVPLLTQLILGPIKLFSSELFQAYVLGKEFPRPFVVPKGQFQELMEQWSGKTDANAAEKPKKAKSIETKKVK